MPQKCSICIHPKRAEIEQAIRNAVPKRTIASQFGIGYNIVPRHAAHMVSEVAANAPAIVQEKQSKAADIVDELYNLKEVLGNALETAVATGNIIALTAVSRELRGVADTLIKIAIAQKEIEAQKKAVLS